MNNQKISLTGKIFSIAALFEAVTWAGLLVGMYFKYVTASTEVLVWWFGRLHGAAFLVYAAMSLVAAWRLRWSTGYTLLALLAAIPPLVTLPLEIWYRRRGLLSSPSEK